MKAPAGTFCRGPLDPLAIDVADIGPRPGQHHPVAVFQISHVVCERGERERVQAEVHLTIAVADGERRAVARADEKIIFPREQKNEGERAAQARERDGDSVDRRAPIAQRLADEVRHHFRVGFGFEYDPLGHEFGFQLAEVLDDAVVDHREPVGGVGVGVGLIGLAVGRPARMADTDRTRQRRLREFQFEVAQLALGAPAVQAAVLQGGDASRVVAAILQTLQSVDDLQRDRRPAQNADNSAHRCVPFLLLRRGDRPRSSTRPPEPNAGHRAPAVLAAQVLPVALQSPNVADLTIAEILENRDKG